MQDRSGRVCSYRVHELDVDMDTRTDAMALPDGTAHAATFTAQHVYALPSAYIASLVASLPDGAKLTREQTLFMARFARSCDEAWADQEKPPRERRVHHILLLGQGGSGKTHVVQNIVFETVQYLWSETSPQEPTLMVVAMSNAQAKNISTDAVKARTTPRAFACSSTSM